MDIKDGNTVTIDNIAPIDHIPRSTRPAKAEVPEKSTPRDSVTFSEEARIKADFEKASAEVQGAPDIRADVVAEAKKKLADPNYLNDTATLEVVADRIVDMFGV